MAITVGVRPCSRSSKKSVRAAVTSSLIASATNSTLTETTRFSPRTIRKARTVPEILRADAGTYQRKAADYAPGTDPFENFRFSAVFAARVCRGLPDTDPRRAAAVLIGVKISRLMSLGLAGEAQNENVIDTLSDLRVYVGILESLL
jgi:hypothetical protein